jgi:hypothetical protein
MTSMRKRKLAVSQALLRRNWLCPHEDRLWDRMPAVGREFGSPDFERLMDEDWRARAGVFDPALIGGLRADLQVPEDLPVQRRKRL